MTMIASFLLGLAGELIVDADDLRAVDVLAGAMAGGGETGMRAALDLAKLIGQAADPATALAALDRSLAAGDFAGDAPIVVASIVIACFATVRADYPARQDATSARSALSARADLAYGTLGAVGAEVLDWTVQLVGDTVLSLSALAATRAPVVRVETGISLPSTLIAWDLYADANRAGEIVKRNRIATPLVMPSAFEALGS